MLSITDLRNEQSTRILDALEEMKTVPITIGITATGEVFARNSECCCIGTSYRDALSKLIQSSTTETT